MLDRADRDISEVGRVFSSRGLETAYLVPTVTGLEKSIMDAHSQLVNYFKKTGIHDFSGQSKGRQAKRLITTWFVTKDDLIETKTSLYRPETKLGDPRIWIYNLGKYAEPWNLLALFAHGDELFVVNTSHQGVLHSADDPASPLSYVLDILTGAKSDPLDDKFAEWNLRLLRSFFSEASSGEEVFLRVDRDFLDQIGQDIGGDAGFIEAVRAGPSWLDRSLSFTRHVIDLVEQREKPSRSYKDPGKFDPAYRGVGAPVYLPYLAALVRNDSITAHSYYSRLEDELALMHSFGSQEMTRVELAWEDLQNWTEANEGRFGYFRLRRLGGYRLIGVPRSQCILKPSDIENLPLAFVQAQVKAGQELSEKAVTRVIDELRANESLFSASFESALRIPDFEQPIRATIRTAYSDWDGGLPAKDNGTLGNDSENVGGRSTGPGIGLSVVADEPLTLAAVWRLHSIAHEGRFEISCGAITWAGQFSGTEGASTELSDENQPSLWTIAERASREDITFRFKHFGTDDTEPSTRQFTLEKKLLWVFVPAYDLGSGRYELREGDLPGSGSVFLLAPPVNAAHLMGYLRRENPIHEKIKALGLPEGWIFVRVDSCESLTEGQRKLPDGHGRPRPKPRVIRFVGGRSIRRGYSRMYLPYDLPTIELDAPEGTQIERPHGIELEEVPYTPAEGAERLHFKPMKRYKIRLSSSRSASYEFRAVNPNGETLNQSKLRISGIGGEVVDVGQPLSLDRIGRAMPSDEGLSGALLSLDEQELFDRRDELPKFRIEEKYLGSYYSSEEWAPSVSELFLDALAQAGSMNYGVARDLMRRLLSSSGQAGDATLMLLELRRAGYLEISKTHKGHIARIHAVRPTFYSLPQSTSCRPVWAVTGTLRLSHWEALTNEAGVWSVYCHRAEALAVRDVILVIESEDEAFIGAEVLEFQFSKMPCQAIIEWAADLGKFRDETFRTTMESIGRAQDSALRFNPSKGLFTATPSGEYCELWKVQDLDTGIDNVYVLVDQMRFAFVRDSRWGVWLALNEFAKWISERHGMEGVHPIPVTYQVSSGTLWLPARISPPHILERALYYCSGCAPHVVSLMACESATDLDRICLCEKFSEQPLFSANRFYSDMANGRWLGYRTVPEPVARLFAEKIGAVLDKI